MEGHSSTGQSPQWAVVPMEGGEEEEEKKKKKKKKCFHMMLVPCCFKNVKVEASNLLACYAVCSRC